MLLKLSIIGVATTLAGVAQIDAATVASAASQVVPGVEPGLARYGALGMLALVLSGLLAAERWESRQRAKAEREERAQVREAHAKQGDAMVAKIEAVGRETVGAIKENTAQISHLSSRIEVLLDRDDR